MSMTSVKINDAIAKRFGLADGTVSYNTAMNDAASGVGFMISQLAYLETQMYAVDYADLFFDRVVPITTGIPEWADNVNYISYNSAARGKFIGSHAKDLPSVSVERQIHNANIAYGGLSLTYSLDDLRKAQHLGMNLDAEQAVMANRAAREHQQRVVFYGDAERELRGFLNNPLVSKANSTLSIATATVEKLADEINTYISEIWTNSNQRYLPNTVCIESALYAKLSTQRMTDTAQVMSALQYLSQFNLYRDQTGQNLQIIPMPQLSAANLKAEGLEEKSMMVVYDKSDRNLASWMPIAPRFIAPQAVALEIITPMEYKFSGTEWRYPNSAMYVQFAA
jgi:hypothetical protein|nr:MAG TPA: major capsid protein [Caudoviricetes sp.]